MKKHTLLALAALTSAVLALPAAAQAQSQSSSQPAAASVAKHAAKKHAAKKPVRKTRKGVPLKAAKAVEAQTPAQTLTDRLSDAELQTAQRIYTGTFPCELGEKVSVTADQANPGFFNVTSGKRRYYMHPVESRTGATRMEDNRHGAVWLQLGNKSMLMDQKAGQRVADDCEAPAQKDFAAHMQNRPQQKLFDAPGGSQQNLNRAANAPAGGASDNSAGLTPNRAPDAPADDAKAFAPVGGNKSPD